MLSKPPARPPSPAPPPQPIWGGGMGTGPGRRRRRRPPPQPLWGGAHADWGLAYISPLETKNVSLFLDTLWATQPIKRGSPHKILLSGSFCFQKFTRWQWASISTRGHLGVRISGCLRPLNIFKYRQSAMRTNIQISFTIISGRGHLWGQISDTII